MTTPPSQLDLPAWQCPPLRTAREFKTSRYIVRIDTARNQKRMAIKDAIISEPS